MNQAVLKKILLFSTKFPPPDNGESIAGQELASSFSRLGYEVFVATIAISTTASEKDHFFSLPNPASLPRVLSTIDPHVIVVNGTLTHQFEPWGTTIHKLAKKYNTPLIYRPHSPIASTIALNIKNPPFFGIYQTLKSFYTANKRIRQYASSNQIVFLSSQEGIVHNHDRRIASSLRLTNVSDIPNTFGSIFLEQNSFCEKYNLSGTLFSYVATFSPRKNQISAIKAIKNSDISNATFVFIAPERNDYAIQAEKLADGDPRFIFLYNIPRADVIEAQNAANCCFLYATQEQQPLVLLEAMSCKKPWICTNVGSVSEMRGGIILKHRRKNDLIQAIKTMQNPKVQKLYGQEGFNQWQTTFSPGSVYARWEEMLSDAVNQKLNRGGY